MATNSANLRLILQATGENPDSWGDVANAGVFQLLEDAVTGVYPFLATGSDEDLSIVNGATDESRQAILHATGGTVDTIVNVPVTATKLYAVVNESTAALTVQVAGGAGLNVVVAAGSSELVFSDGTNVLSAASPSTIANADLATNSLQLGGVVAASWARKDEAQTFTGAQAVARSTLTSSGAAVVIDASLSNTFYLELNENTNMNAATGFADGQTMRIVIDQGSGAGHTITWDSVYKWGSGVAPVMSSGAFEVDYISMEYVGTLGYWVCGFIQDIK